MTERMTPRRDLPEGELIDIPQSYRILSLSGGGYRGLFTAQLLARIEAMPEFAGEPIGNRFDMIAGTSVGGLIAVALAHGVKAQRIVEVLEKHGPTIFPEFIGKRWLKLFGRQVYSPGPLEAAIKACVGDAATKPFASISKSLMLTTVSWTAGQLILLRSGQLSQVSNPRVCSILDATCATSAAPAHFPARLIDGDWYVDGGLVANCPDLHALHEGEHLNVPIKMLSIGTAGVTRASTPDAIPQRGVAWAKPALDLGIQAQEKHAQDSCRLRLKQAYLHLNKRPDVDQALIRDLDRATPDITTTLKKLADQRFEELLKSHSEKSALKQIVSPTRIVP